MVTCCDWTRAELRKFFWKSEDFVIWKKSWDKFSQISALGLFCSIFDLLCYWSTPLLNCSVSIVLVLLPAETPVFVLKQNSHFRIKMKINEKVSLRILITTILQFKVLENLQIIIFHQYDTRFISLIVSAPVLVVFDWNMFLFPFLF